MGEWLNGCGLNHISSNISPHDDIIGEVGGSLCDTFFAFPSALKEIESSSLGSDQSRNVGRSGGGGFISPSNAICRGNIYSLDEIMTTCCRIVMIPT